MTFPRRQRPPRRRVWLPGLGSRPTVRGGGVDGSDVRARSTAWHRFDPTAVGAHVALPGRAHGCARHFRSERRRTRREAARRGARSCRLPLRRRTFPRPRSSACPPHRGRARGRRAPILLDLDAAGASRILGISPTQLHDAPEPRAQESSRRLSVSQRDVLAELRDAQVTARPRCAERVRLIAVAERTPPRAARDVEARARRRAAGCRRRRGDGRLQRGPSHKPAEGVGPSFSAASLGRRRRSSAQRAATPDLAVPSTPNRVQVIGTTLSLRIRTAQVSRTPSSVQCRSTTSLSGYAAAVHEQTHGKAASAELTLKVPRAPRAAGRRAPLAARHDHRRAGRRDRQDSRPQHDSPRDPRSSRSSSRQHARQPRQTRRSSWRSPRTSCDCSGAKRRHGSTRTSQRSSSTSRPLPSPAKTHHHGPLHGVGVALKWLGSARSTRLRSDCPSRSCSRSSGFAIRLIRRRRVDALLSR